MADGFVVVGRDAGNIFDFLEIIANLFGLSFHALNDGGHSFVNATFDIHRVSACGYVFQSVGDDSLCKHGGCGCAVAGVVACFRGNFFHELCAHVLEGIFEFDFACHCHTVFGDVGCTVFLVDDYIAAFRAEGHFHCVGQSVNAFFQFFAGFDIEFYFFCHDVQI